MIRRTFALVAVAAANDVHDGCWQASMSLLQVGVRREVDPGEERRLADAAEMTARQVLVRHTDTPQVPGCYVYTATGCPSGVDGPQRGVWMVDNMVGSDSSLGACVQRKQSYDKLCQIRDAHMLLVTADFKSDCPDWCADHSEAWSSKCRWRTNLCSSCSPCATDDAAPSALTRQDSHGECPAWCEDHSDPWASKCQWRTSKCRKCSSCPSEEAPTTEMQASGDHVEWQSVSGNDEPNSTQAGADLSPGCYVWTATGCDWRENGPKSYVWQKDSADIAWTSEQCEARKAEYDAWCLVNDTKTKFVEEQGAVAKMKESSAQVVRSATHIFTQVYNATKEQLTRLSSGEDVSAGTPSVATEEKAEAARDWIQATVQRVMGDDAADHDYLSLAASLSDVDGAGEQDNADVRADEVDVEGSASASAAGDEGTEGI